MLGKPKFNEEDLVTFEFDVEGKVEKINGVIYVVDPYGTTEQAAEPSYDIEAFFRGEVLLFKHIRESKVSARA